MAKEAVKNDSMSFTSMAGVLLVGIVLLAAAKGGAFAAINGHHSHGPRRHGTFVVVTEWHALPGGVYITITRNGTHIVGPDHMVRATSPGKPQVSRFPGWSTDSVVVRSREIDPSAAPEPNGFLYVSISFHGEDGNVSLPVFMRDTAPVDMLGVRAQW